MPSSVRSLVECVGPDLFGPVRWGVPPGLATAGEQGVYLISIASDPDSLSSMGQPIFDDDAIASWLARCPAISVDGQPADSERIKGRLREFWLPDETVLYIGKVESGTSKRSIRMRVSEYYRTPIGASSPHRGGAWLKSLANLRDLSVFWTTHDHPAMAERDMIGAFAESTTRESRLGLLDSEHPWPFANIRLEGVDKVHGMKRMAD